MGSFSKDYVIGRIAKMEDGGYTATELYKKDDLPEDSPEDLKELIAATEAAVCIEYSDLGEQGYDAFGIYAFAKDEEGYPYSNLSITIILGQGVDEMILYDMYKIINLVNTKINPGAFALSEGDNILYYRSSIAVPRCLEDEDALKLVSLQMLTALSHISKSIDVLMGLEQGTMDYFECIEALGF